MRRRDLRPRKFMSPLDAEICGYLDGVYGVEKRMYRAARRLTMRNYPAYSRGWACAIEDLDLWHDYQHCHDLVFSALDEQYGVVFPESKLRGSAYNVARALQFNSELADYAVTEIEPHVLAWRRARTSA